MAGRSPFNLAVERNQADALSVIAVVKEEAVSGGGCGAGGGAGGPTLSRRRGTAARPAGDPEAESQALVQDRAGTIMFPALLFLCIGLPLIALVAAVVEAIIAAVA